MKIIVTLFAIIFAIGCITEPNTGRSPEYKSSEKASPDHNMNVTLQALHKLESDYAKIIITGVHKDRMSYKFADYPAVAFRDLYVFGNIGDTVVVRSNQLSNTRMKFRQAKKYYELMELVKDANNSNW